VVDRCLDLATVQSSGGSHGALDRDVRAAPMASAGGRCWSAAARVVVAIGSIRFGGRGQRGGRQPLAHGFVMSRAGRGASPGSATRHDDARDNGKIIERVPSAVLRPGSATDIAKMIRFLPRARLQVATRGRRTGT